MVIYKHGIESGIELKAEKLPRMGWTITGRKPNANYFRVLAVKSHGKGFDNFGYAMAALKKVKALTN